MSRRILPSSQTDWVLLATAGGNLLFGGILLSFGEVLTALLTLFGGICCLGLYWSAARFGARGGPRDPYRNVLQTIRQTSNNLRDLSGFLDEERHQVERVQSTLRSLRDEKNSLENLVGLRREQTMALFAVYDQIQRKGVWKERMIGFGLGILGSVLASYLYTWLTKPR